MSNIKKVKIADTTYDIDAKTVDGHAVEETGIASNTTTIPTTAQVKAYVDANASSGGGGSGGGGSSDKIITATKSGNTWTFTLDNVTYTPELLYTYLSGILYNNSAYHPDDMAKYKIKYLDQLFTYTGKGSYEDYSWFTFNSGIKLYDEYDYYQSRYATYSILIREDSYDEPYTYDVVFKDSGHLIDDELLDNYMSNYTPPTPTIPSRNLYFTSIEISKLGQVDYADVITINVISTMSPADFTLTTSLNWGTLLQRLQSSYTRIISVYGYRNKVSGEFANRDYTMISMNGTSNSSYLYAYYYYRDDNDQYRLGSITFDKYSARKILISQAVFDFNK